MRIRMFIMSAALLILISTANAQAAYGPITAENFEQIELGYVLPTRCGQFSPDGNLIAVAGDGLYDLHMGERRFQTDGPDGFYGDFSPDSTLLATYGGRVYDVESGESKFSYQGASPFFSPDGTLLAVSRDGMYDVVTGEKRVPLTNAYGPYPDTLFSPDGQLLATIRDGVYDLVAMRKLYTTSADRISFTADSRLFISNDGVFEAHTGRLRFAINSAYSALPTIGPSGKLLAVSGDGVYDLETHARLIEIGEVGSVVGKPTFSPDETLVVTDAVYDVATGAQVASVHAPGTFNVDGTLFAAGWDHLYRVDNWKATIPLVRAAQFALDDALVTVNYDGMYNAATGEQYTQIPPGWYQFNANNTLLAIQAEWLSQRIADRPTPFCMIYGLSDNDWPYRSGLVRVEENTNLRETPDRNSPLVTATIHSYLPVLATTSDHQWYQVSDDLWVAAWVVEIIALPDDIPVVES